MWYIITIFFVCQTLKIFFSFKNFDINFIYDNLIKLGKEPLKNDFVDTLRLSRKLLPNLNHHRLSDLTNYYKINNKGSHRAMRDTEMTLEVLQMLAKEKSKL